MALSSARPREADSAQMNAGVADDESRSAPRPTRAAESSEVPSLLPGEQRRQHGASQLGDDEPQALALDQALDDQPRSAARIQSQCPGDLSYVNQ
jgi:hypothetical protein